MTRYGATVVSDALCKLKVATSRKVEPLMLAESGVFDIKRYCCSLTMEVITAYIFGHPLDASVLAVLVEFFSYKLAPEFQLRIMGLFYLPLPSRVGFFRSRSRALALIRDEICKAEPDSFAAFAQGQTEQDMDKKLSDLVSVFSMLFALRQLTSANRWVCFSPGSRPLPTRSRGLCIISPHSKMCVRRLCRKSRRSWRAVPSTS